LDSCWLNLERRHVVQLIDGTQSHDDPVSIRNFSGVLADPTHKAVEYCASLEFSTKNCLMLVAFAPYRSLRRYLLRILPGGVGPSLEGVWCSSKSIKPPSLHATWAAFRHSSNSRSLLITEVTFIIIFI
jgi:hypothetical protein